MFVQVIQGRVRDLEGLQQRIDEWLRDLRPGAAGWLGTTAGVTAAGQCIILARFDSETAARRNNDRPEQGAWWERASRCFDDDVSFRDSVEVDLSLSGGSDAARFVQVMQGWTIDRDRLRRLEAEAEPILKELRPDLIGSVRAWHDDGGFTEALYFTSEAAARAGEARMADAPSDVAAGLNEWGSLLVGVTFLDLPHPWLASA